MFLSDVTRLREDKYPSTSNRLNTTDWSNKISYKWLYQLYHRECKLNVTTQTLRFLEVMTAFSKPGRRVYGLGAIALGLVGLGWGDFATVWQPIQALPFTVPHREALAYIAAACLLSAGVAIQWRRSAPAGLLVLAILYFIFALLWLPRVIGYPQIFGTWGGFLEEFALVAAAVVAYASLLPHGSANSVRTARIGRLSFGVCVLSFGLGHFFAIPQTAAMVPSWIPPGQQFWAVATGVAHLLAGIAILSGVPDVLGSRLLTVMLATFGALVWAPALFAQPREHMVWAGNAINLALIGAAWVVADSIASHHQQTRGQEVHEALAA
ncbi:MAG: hypothetical protein QOH49_2921 [Acidobacteriota bacterium]|nr:hypothetical protein [Acidobacteriota bacterium]